MSDAYLQDFPEDKRLHACVVDPSASAAKLDAVEDEIVMVGLGLRRRRAQQVDVVRRPGRRKRMVSRTETRGAALTWLRLCRWREERKVGDPEEIKALGGGQKALCDGSLMQRQSKVSKHRRAAGERSSGSRLRDQSVAVLEREGILQALSRVEAKGLKTLQRLTGVDHKDPRTPMRMFQERLRLR